MAAYQASLRDPMQVMNHPILVVLQEPPKPNHILYFRDYLGTKATFWHAVRDFESTIKRIVFCEFGSPVLITYYDNCFFFFFQFITVPEFSQVMASSSLRQSNMQVRPYRSFTVD